MGNGEAEVVIGVRKKGNGEIQKKWKRKRANKMKRWRKGK